MEAAFCDTSAWYALLSPDDAHHAKAKRFVEGFTGTLLTSNYVVAETANLLQYRHGTAPALVFLQMLRETNLVDVLYLNSEQHERAATLFAERASNGLSFTDCSSLAVMQEQQLTTAFCFDADFAGAGVQCVP